MGCQGTRFHRCGPAELGELPAAPMEMSQLGQNPEAALPSPRESELVGRGQVGRVPWRPPRAAPSVLWLHSPAVAHPHGRSWLPEATLLQPMEQ